MSFLIQSSYESDSFQILILKTNFKTDTFLIMEKVQIVNGMSTMFFNIL